MLRRRLACCEVAVLLLGASRVSFAQAPPAPETPPPEGAAASPGGELGLFQMAEDIRSLTVTAVSKREETIGEAPATVTVITREDFERYGWTSVAEALRSVPGMYVSYGRDYFYTGVHGVSLPRDVDTRILVLVDGHTMNDPWNAASQTSELITLPPDAIERVEVIRGPSSSIYGSNAFFAVVNIVSRQAPTMDEPEERTRLQPALSWASSPLADFGSERVPGLLRASVAGHHRFAIGLDVSAFAVGVLGDGGAVRFSDMTRPRLNCCDAAGNRIPISGTTAGTDYTRGYNLGAQASWRGFTLQLQWNNRSKGLPSAPADSIFGDPYNSLSDAHGFVELRYRRDIGEHHHLLARVYYDQFRSRQFLHRDPSDWPQGTWFSDDPHTVSEGNDDTLGGEVQGTFQLHAHDTLVVGSEGQGHSITQPTYELDPSTGAPIPASVAGCMSRTGCPPIAYQNFALYAQNDWRPADKLGVVLGLRFDYNGVFTRFDQGLPSALGAFAPRAAVIYSATRDLTVKVLYGEAFRNPSIFEAFFDDGASVCANADVRPERLRTAELAGYLQARRGVNLTASLYYTRVEGLLVKEPVTQCFVGSGPRLHFVNRGEVNVFGGEVGLDLRLPGGWGAYGSVSLAYARQADPATGVAGPLANSPVAIASAGAAVPIWRDVVSISARANFVSPRLDWTLDATRPESPYVRLDLSVLARRLVGGFGGSLTLTNVLGLPYRDPVTSSETIPTAIPQDGIALFARIFHAL